MPARRPPLHDLAAKVEIGLSALVVLAAPRDRDLDEFLARDRHRRLVERVQRARARHRDLEAQRRLVAHGLELVRRSVRHLHEKALRRDERRKPLDREADLPALDNPKGARVGMQAPRRALAGRHRDVLREHVPIVDERLAPARAAPCCARSSASFQCGRCTPT